MIGLQSPVTPTVIISPKKINQFPIEIHHRKNSMPAGVSSFDKNSKAQISADLDHLNITKYADKSRVNGDDDKNYYKIVSTVEPGNVSRDSKMQTVSMSSAAKKWTEELESVEMLVSGPG